MMSADKLKPTAQQPIQHRLKRVAIFGVGLIGGSFALALKKAGAVEHVVGVGRSLALLELCRTYWESNTCRSYSRRYRYVSTAKMFCATSSAAMANEKAIEKPT